VSQKLCWIIYLDMILFSLANCPSTPSGAIQLNQRPQASASILAHKEPNTTTVHVATEKRRERLWQSIIW
jgi:hypothetical protein